MNPWTELERCKVNKKKRGLLDDGNSCGREQSMDRQLACTEYTSDRFGMDFI